MQADTCISSADRRLSSVHDGARNAIYGPIDEIDDHLGSPVAVDKEHSPYPEVRIQITQPLVAVPSRHDLRDGACLGHDVPTVHLGYSVIGDVESFVL